MRNRSAFTLLLLSLPLAAAAAPDTRYREPGYGGLSYTLGEARVVARDPDGAGDADGGSLGGSARITPDLFVTGSLTSVGSGGYDEDLASRPARRRQPRARRPAARGGVRTLLTPKIEIGGYARYTNLYDNGDLGLRAEGLYNFTPNFSALASAGLSNNERTASVGGRWYFRPGN